MSVILLLLIILILVNISSQNNTYYSPLYLEQKSQQSNNSFQQQQQPPTQQQLQSSSSSSSSPSSSSYIPRPELDRIHRLPYLSNSLLYNASESLKEPIKLVSFNGKLNVDLTIKAYRYDNGLVAFNTRIYCYLDYCSIPGPVLSCKPGDIIEVRITNELNTNDANSLYVNSTNFYIHGLHLDPKTNNFSTSTTGNGKVAIYTFRVPNDHHPGNHWYHSHKHGTSALHVMGGLFGSLVVSPLEDTDLPTEISSMKRTNLVFSHLNLDDNKTTVALATGTIDIYSYQRLSQKLQSSLPINPSFKDSMIKDLWLTNGQYQPSYTIRPGEWQIFDLLAASGDRILEIEIRTSIGISNGDYACNISLLAIDGVYLQNSRTRPLSNHLVLVQGSRASIAVSCSISGTYYLQSATSMDPSNPYWRIGDLDTKSSQNLLTLNVVGEFIQDGEDGAMAPPTDLSSIPRPVYLKNISTVVSSSERKWSISMDQSQCPSSSLSPVSKYWMGMGQDCTLACFNMTDCTRLYGATYCVQSQPSVLADKCSYDYFVSKNRHSAIEGNTEILNVWSWSGSLSSIHMPMNHFQYLSHDDGDGTNLGSFFSLPGDWRDTWPTLKGDSMLRMYFTDFTGSRIIHNNYLSYEDDGLFSTFQVIKPLPISLQPPPATVVNPNVTVPAVVTNEGQSIVITDMQSHQTPKPVFYYDRCDVDGKSFYYQEIIDVKKRVRTIISNSCPNHFSSCQKEACSGDQSSLAKPKNITISIPLFPEFSRYPTDTSCTTDAIAIALNGVLIKGPSDGSMKCTEPSSVYNVSYGKTLCSLHGINDGIEYCGDAVQVNGREFDKCGGFSDYDGVYHYRITPVCLLAQMLAMKNLTGFNAPVTSSTFMNIGDFASPQIGWAYDGFPVYGPYGPYGLFMAPCNTSAANPDVCLDSCNGYYGKLPGIDDFMYRYYMSGEHGKGNCSSSVQNVGSCLRNTDQCCTSTVPSTVYSPYSIGCYRGCLDVNGCTRSGERGYTETYIPSVANYPNEMVKQDGYPSVSIQPPLVRENDIIPTVVIQPPTPLPVEDKGNLSFDVGTRLVVVRVPTNRSVILATFGKNSNGMNNMSTEEIPSSRSDTFISDMAFDVDSSTVFYASESGIYSFNIAQKNIINQVIAGILVVEISGYNFGNSLSDIYSITIKGDPCTSLDRVDSENIKCVCVSAACNRDDVTVSDVVLSTVGGNTQGIYAQPYIILKSGTGRPVVSSITLKKQTFLPNALSLVRTGLNATLYWSNIGVGSYSIQRCRLDGTQIETVGKGVQRGLGIHVIPRNNTDVIFFTDGSTNTLYRLETPAMNSLIFYGPLSPIIPVITGLETPTDVYVEDLSGFLFLTVLDGYLLKMSLDVVIAIQSTPANASYVVPGVVYTTNINLRNGRKSLPVWTKLIVRGSSMSRYSGSIALPSCKCNFTTCPLSWNEQRVFIADTNQQLVTLTTDYGYPTTSLNVFNAFPGLSSIVWPIAFANKYDIHTPQTCDKPIVLYVAEYLGKIWEVTIPRNKLTGIPSLESLPFPKLMLDKSSFVTSSTVRNILASLPIQRKVLGPQLVFEMIS